MLLIDTNDPKLMSRVGALQPSPGICVFIDVVGSTQMKQRSVPEWVALISGVFEHSQTFLQRFKPLKGIGDELMYFIEESELARHGETHLTTVDSLFQIAQIGDGSLPDTKIVAALCQNAYPMTFLEGSRDYYGADVDRTARLKGITPALEARQVVIDGALYDSVRQLVLANGGATSFEWAPALHGPYNLEAKGLPLPVQYYRATV